MLDVIILLPHLLLTILSQIHGLLLARHGPRAIFLRRRSLPDASARRGHVIRNGDDLVLQLHHLLHFPIAAHRLHGPRRLRLVRGLVRDPVGAGHPLHARDQGIDARGARSSLQHPDLEAHGVSDPQLCLARPQMDPLAARSGAFASVDCEEWQGGEEGPGLKKQPTVP